MQYTLLASSILAAGVMASSHPPAYYPAPEAAPAYAQPNQASWPSAAPAAAAPWSAPPAAAAPSAAAAPWSAPAAHPSAAAAAGPGQTVHIVEVSTANASLFFYPENTIAKPGDLVQFQFWPKNHSVVQSAFDSPCMPLLQTQPNATNAFFSGFMPTTRSRKEEEALVYTIPVVNERPMWFYCSQGRHCQQGMVGAINSPETTERSIAAYKQLASSRPENLSPGQVPSAQDPNPASGTPASNSNPPSAPGSPTTLATAPAGTGAGLVAAESPLPASGANGMLGASRGLVVAIAMAGLAVLAF